MTIRIGLALGAGGIIIVPFVRDIPLVLVSVLAGVGVGMVWTNTDQVVSKLAKEGRMGATMGMAGSFKELGDMVGPVSPRNNGNARLSTNEVRLLKNYFRGSPVRRPRTKNQQLKTCAVQQRRHWGDFFNSFK